MRGCSSLGQLWPHLVDAVAAVSDLPDLRSLEQDILRSVGVPESCPDWVAKFKESLPALSPAAAPAQSARVVPPLPPAPLQPPVGAGALPPLVGLRLWGHRGLPLEAVRGALIAHLGADLGLNELAMSVGSWVHGRLDRARWDAVSNGAPEVVIPDPIGGGPRLHVTTQRFDGTPLPVPSAGLAPPTVSGGRPRSCMALFLRVPGPRCCLPPFLAAGLGVPAR
jgi:hypothetical protein